MKKYIIAATTILAINNTPTGASPAEAEARTVEVEDAAAEQHKYLTRAMERSSDAINNWRAGYTSEYDMRRKKYR